MNLPRLIIADDTEGQRVVPSSILLVQAMKSCGVRLNVFMSSRKEEDLRLTLSTSMPDAGGGGRTTAGGFSANALDVRDISRDFAQEKADELRQQ